MSFSLRPDYVFNDYTAVTPAFLHTLGVRVLLTDLDYTLAPKSQPEPDEGLLRWVQALRDGDHNTAEIIQRHLNGEYHRARVLRVYRELK